MILARFAVPLFVWTLAAGLGATPGRAQVDGDLDPSFFPPNGSGVALLYLGQPNFFSDTVKATVVQPDGKIVVETSSILPGGDSAVGILRLNPDGSTDLAFGNNGVTYFQLNGYTGPGGLLLQPDGRIVVGGTAPQSSDSTIFVGRLTPSGLLDTTFNPPWGYTTFDFFSQTPGSYGEGLAAMALQTDGKIVLAGDLVPGTNRDIGVARLNGDGSVDTAFGGQLCGCTSVAFDLGGTLNDYARAVAIDSDGKIVVAGQSHWGSNDFDWAVFRLTPGGLLDTSFNSTGSEILPWDLSPESTDIPSRIATLPDGRFVVGGTATVDEQGTTFVHAVLARFGAGGGLDPTFGPGAHPGQCTQLAAQLNADHLGLAADAHGELWVGYETTFAYGATRLDADCQPVFPIVTGGQTFDVLENGFGDLVVTPDQRVVITGTTYGAFPGYRYVAALRLWVAELFRDGFESANPSRWSSTVQ